VERRGTRLSAPAADVAGALYSACFSRRPVHWRARMMPPPGSSGGPRDSAGWIASLSALLPSASAPPRAIDLPPIQSAEDVAEAGSALIAAVSAGAIDLRDAQGVMKLLTAQMRLLNAGRGARRGTGR
jgi:hypothetical protein